MRNAPGVDRQRGEARHRVDDQALAVALADGGDLLQRVEHAGAGLAVDQDHVGDAADRLQARVERRRRDRLVLGEAHDAAAPAHHLGELGGALAVRAVVEHQHVAVARHHGGHRGLDAERAAALQRHDDVRVVAMHDVEQAAPHARRHGVEVAVPRAPVVQHRELGAQRGRQRAGGQQDAVAVHRSVSCRVVASFGRPPRIRLRCAAGASPSRGRRPQAASGVVMLSMPGCGGRRSRPAP